MPGASFVVFVATLGTVGIPLEGLAFIAEIHRILDMARTLSMLSVTRWRLLYCRSGKVGLTLRKRIHTS